MKYFLLIASILHLFAGNAQTEDTKDCRQLIRNYMTAMSKYKNPEKDKVYSMQMEVETDYRQGSDKTDTRVSTSIHVSGYSKQYESNLVSYYTDRNQTFTVIHPEKLIYWQDGEITANQDNYAVITMLMDSLFKHSKLDYCRELKYEGRKVKEIKFTPDEKFKKSTQIRALVYYFDVKENRIYRLVTYFLETSEKEKQVVTYHSLSFNSKYKMFTSARNKIFSGKGTLNEKFRNYKIVDQRKNRSK
jgi:hypothetical protein